MHPPKVERPPGVPTKSAQAAAQQQAGDQVVLELPSPVGPQVWTGLAEDGSKVSDLEWLTLMTMDWESPDR